jgi:S1-C subfamily serine protease
VDNQGHIITNNHVVDDGAGGISDDFAICMTDNPSLPPRCHYTASVINRDAKADIAILQLNSVDIFGKKVDFSALTTLSINMDYQPQSGDPVIARGYPWV